MIKKTVIVTTVMFLMLFTACGGMNNLWKNPGNKNNTDVSISISQSMTIRVGESGILRVTRRNTDDFTISVNPAIGSGCSKSGNNAVTCTPTAPGTYIVTVTASADTLKKASATVTVSEGTIDVPGASVNKTLLLQLVNSHRAAGRNCGSSGYFEPTTPVTWNDTIELAAYDHSLDMFINNFLGHTGSDGSSPGDRLTRRGYDWSWRGWGENAYWGPRTEAEVIAGWIDSPGHCANIMNPFWNEMGVAKVGAYWTQVFSARLF